MPKEMSREERAEYQRNYRKTKAEEPEEAPNPKNAIAGTEEGIYGLAWDGVIGGMRQAARDAILKGMGQTKRNG